MKRQTPPRRPSREDFQQALQSMDTFVDISVDDLITLTDRAEHLAGRRATEALNVARVMTRPVLTVHPGTLLSEAAHLLVTERISGLPVVDDAECLTGIITEADFLRALGVPSHHPTHSIWKTLETMIGHLAHHTELEVPEDPVSEHMVTDVICARPDQDLHGVIELMRRHRVKRVVVCDGERRVLGMVTRSDLVRVFFDRCTGRT
jgi:CBS domain-containing membrane protein